MKYITFKKHEIPKIVKWRKAEGNFYYKKMKEILIKVVDSTNCYDNYFKQFIGDRYWALDQIDNQGDITVIDAPFVFIPCFLCKLITTK